MSGVGKVVCVTGASGFIASWLVKFLLQRGYTVNGSVLDPSDPMHTEHLRALDGAKERLNLFKADLMEDDTFDSAIEGCECVFHTASPCNFDVKDPQEELLDPAVKGTLNVLKSCAKVPTIKRVILTSSMGAVVNNRKARTPDVVVVDESWFSDPDMCREMKLWYVLSKTLAEDAAWQFVKERGLDMVTINPAMAIGPLLQPTMNASSDEILKLINGATSYPNASCGFVNVKDIANAHIKAFEIPSANGRYCVVERCVHYSELVKILKELYPSLQLPDKRADDKPFMPVYQGSKDKFKSLGLDYIPLETSLKETVDSLLEKKFVTF